MSKLRHASSLILVTRNGLVKNPIAKNNDISTVALRRSQKASHFPDSYVFPGGYCDPADENPDWLKVLPQSELNVQLNLKEKLPESSSNSVLPKAVSRRITAIRETFEECGILLCKQETNSIEFLAKNYELENKDIWREKIRNDPFEFYNFCQTYKCFPNLKCLHLLSNWITPITYLKRFNSIFFIAAVDHEIESEADHKEIQVVKWGPVNYFLNDENIFLPPPQVYELMRLRNFANFDVLCKFLTKLDNTICEAYLPIHVNTSDGFVMILPGDEKYEEFLNMLTGNTIDLEYEIVRFRGKIMNRVEYKYQDGSKATKAEAIVKNVGTDNLTDTHLQSKL
ncbi:acyl-coenzyme A diphosphatase NUDT19-like isoform X1 [Planococcus citri]|uniref:acyl-coenzyme A diphosphatase NUDT19-like isoform X1 n=1 Tax=Planococcus citri TaxID=170843 RepID=UPI0031F755D3